MPVTEFAHLPLKPGYDEVDLLELLMECQETQDAWVRANLPGTVADDASVSNVYVDESTTPPSLLITAHWDSPEDHHRWIQTDENKATMGKLARFLEEGNTGPLLYHMTSGGRRPQMHEAFRAKGCLNIWRLAVPPASKDELQEAYSALEKAMFDEDSRDRIWGGWRIEKDTDNEELTIFWSDTVPEDKIAQLKELPHASVVRHRFKQIV
ncbi:hypothetical protein K4F52_005571 [Lecanicillium sp. MT-2017a]|nr:hypothetical protein K4F52_005571 [Lecanicillium sp. MT-2017a]